MNKSELKKIMKIANGKEDLSNVDMEKFLGCAFPSFEKVHATSREVAHLFRWQAMQFNGEWDGIELDNCCKIARDKFIILD